MAIHSIDIDPDGAYLSAVNSKVCLDTECKYHRKSVNQIPSHVPRESVWVSAVIPYKFKVQSPHYSTTTIACMSLPNYIYT